MDSYEDDYMMGAYDDEGEGGELSPMAFSLLVCCCCCFIVSIACGAGMYYLFMELQAFVNDPFGYIAAYLRYLFNMKDSYGNGVGKPLECSADEQQIVGYCYPKCPAGSSGLHNNDYNCWSNCPDGWWGNGLFPTCETKQCAAGQHESIGNCYDNCPDNYDSDGSHGCYARGPSGWNCSITECTKPSAIYRSPTVPQQTCPAGWTVEGIGNAGWCSRYVFPNLTTQHSQKTCPAGKSQDGDFCYNNCPDGYHVKSGLPDWCSPNCPANWHDSGVNCQRPRHNVEYRGPATKTMNRENKLARADKNKALHACPSGTVKDPDGVLCYPPCKNKDGFTYVMKGPVCWQDRPEDRKVDVGDSLLPDFSSWFK